MRDPEYTSGTNEHGTPIETVTVFNEDGTVYLSIDQEKVPVYNRPFMTISQDEAEMLNGFYSGVEA